MADALRNLIGDDDCLKPSLTEMKLEPADVDGGDLLQQSNLRKADKIRAILTENVSPESRRTVENILEQVHKLSTLDKLLLYLKLPTGRPAEASDPLRQPLNPLGSRSEIQLTINWIRSHYEEDPQVSLPKHEVYDDYTGYCNINTVKPLSTADFGKVMKQVFPAVRPRRLGTRGNSRYCYAGLRKRLKLDPPLTPDISADPGRSRDNSAVGGEEEANNAASFLIREWVEKLLQVKFDNLPDLACHLLDKMYVDNRSVAAFTLLSRAGQLDIKTGLQSNGSTAGPGGQDSKLQLQRKLQEVSLKQVDGGKRKLSEQELLVGKRSKVGGDMELDYDMASAVGMEFDVGSASVVTSSQQDIKDGNQSRYSVVVQNNQTGQPSSILPDQPVYLNGGSSSIASYEPAPAPVSLAEFQVSYNGERIDTGPRQVTVTSSISLDKLPRKKQVVLVGGGDLTNQETGFLLSSTNQKPVNGLTSVIKAGEKPRKYKEEWVGDGETNMVLYADQEPADLSGAGQWQPAAAVPAPAMLDNGHEETELVQYFQHQPDISDADNDEKLSQLRQLLAKNLTPQAGSNGTLVGAFKPRSMAGQLGGKPLETVISSAGESNNMVASGGTMSQLSTRRRVSFHPQIISDTDNTGGMVPPSPGTSRRRHFSFQPISPGSGRHASSGQSPPASPFISPRSTPVHMLRSRHSSGSALPLHLLPGNGGRQQHPSGSGSDISRAATFGSASESSTPFISPMGTPIPFNIRSRHNSASGRLTRSRHSSGVPLERQFGRQLSGNISQTTFIGSDGGGLERQYSTAPAPYSPMALNNLNNPFSPQPNSNLDMTDTGMVGVAPGGGQYSSGQVVPGGQVTVVAGGQYAGVANMEQDRSRHSSAGSDGNQCHARSAPMSPFHDSNGVHVRQRHVSAGHVPVSASSHTIHYRPVAEFDQSYSGTGNVNSFNNGDTMSHHSSYRNTPVPQEFQSEAEAEFRGLMGADTDMVTGNSETANEAPGPENKIKDDDIDLALDALRNCDTDFIKFDEANSVSS